MSRVKRFAVGAVVAMLALTGCTAQTASVRQSAFETYFAHGAGVASTHQKGATAGVVTLAADASDSQLSSALDRAAAWLGKPKNSGWSVNVITGGWTFHATPSVETNHYMGQLHKGVDFVPNIESVDVGTKRIAMTLTPGSDFGFVWGVASQLVTAPYWPANAATFRVTSGSVTETTGAGVAYPVDADKAFSALSQKYQVTSANVSPSGLDVQLGDAADVAPARALARKSAPKLGSLDVGSDFVTTAPGGDLSAANAVVAALGHPAGVRSIYASSRSMQLYVDSIADAAAVRARLAAIPAAARIPEISFTSWSRQQPAFDVTGSVKQLAGRITTVSSLLPTDKLDQLYFTQSGIYLNVGEVTSVSTAPLADSLRKAVAAGTTVRVTSGSRFQPDLGLTFVAKSKISDFGNASFGTSDPAAFVAAWNTAS